MSQRTRQVGSEIRSLLSAILVRLLEFPPGVMVSVYHVIVSPNLKEASALITIHPRERQDEIFFMLKKALPEIRKELGARLTTKFTPKLTFRIDESHDKAERINAILDNLSSSG